MSDFNFSNDEIVFLHKHFSDYRNIIENQLHKQIRLAQGQLELVEQLYGDDPTFDRENFELNLRLVKEEIPKAITERMDFVKNIIEKFSDIYSMIAESDPDLVKSVEEKYFDDPKAITNIINQLKNKNNEEDGDED